MSREAAVIATVAAGALVGLQAPINSTLGRTVGTLTGAALAFVLGTVVLVAVAVAVEGFRPLRPAFGLPPYYLTGSVIAAVYVVVALLSVRVLGGGGVTAATISGQITASLVVDRLGVLGVEPRPLSTGRLVGVGLLLVGTYLVVRE